MAAGLEHLSAADADAGIRASHRAYLQTQYFSSLDGLRAFAILAVVWHHAAADRISNLVLKRGFLGVDLFFLISGFLITTLLLRERDNSGDVSLKKFYWRRVLRIVPAYWLMLGVAAGIGWAGHRPVWLHDLPYAALYISNFVVMLSPLAITWSLSAEEQFYLCIPALVKYAKRALPYALVPCYILIVLPTFGLAPRLAPFFHETTFGPIMLGVMLALVLHSQRGWGLAAPVLRRWWMPLFAVALALTVLRYPGQDMSGLPRIGIHLALLLLLASCVVRRDNLLCPVLTFWPIRRIGLVSYGIYLYHMITMGMLLQFLSSGYVLFVLTAGVTWVTAEVSFAVLERRFLKLKPRSPGISQI